MFLKYKCQRPEFQKWDGCKWADAETRGGLSFAGSGRGGFCTGKIYFY